MNIKKAYILTKQHVSRTYQRFLMHEGASRKDYEGFK